jgi:prophage maintenance system killer protein
VSGKPGQAPLDVVLSVGYRVQSRTATQFRQWATRVLHQHITDEQRRRLDTVATVGSMLERATSPELIGIGELLNTYGADLDLLHQYDKSEFPPPIGTTTTRYLDYEEARTVIDTLAARYPNEVYFGQENDGVLRGVLGQIRQTFDGHELYPSTQEKATNLLYMLVKDHPLADGNKRSAAALFNYFLSQNHALRSAAGAPLLSKNTLAAVTLLVSMSDPKEKDQVVGFVRSMLG